MHTASTLLQALSGLISGPQSISYSAHLMMSYSLDFLVGCPGSIGKLDYTDKIC
jgi:hypothetical protein